MCVQYSGSLVDRLSYTDAGSWACYALIDTKHSLVPRPHTSLREGEGLVKNGNIPGPEAGIWESQLDRSICN